MKRVIEDADDICATSQRAVQDNDTSLHATNECREEAGSNGARLDLPPVDATEADCRITQTVVSGFCMTSDSLLKTGIRVGLDHKVMPAERLLQGANVSPGFWIYTT